MKVVVKGEEQDYSRSIRSAGLKTGLAGLAVGVAAVAGLQKWYIPFRHLPLYIKSTTAIYPGMFAISIGANRAAHAYESSLHPEMQKYIQETKRLTKEIHDLEPRDQRARDWLHEYQYYILGAVWASTMAIGLERMRKDRVTPEAMKLVQARLPAQAATIAALLAIAAFEVKDKAMGKGKFQPVMVVDRQEQKM
ncbi:Respiratory supercomplex factor 2 -like protein [Hapsidospora chrysogenum ATCC 11550]|uniref:Respiratory supercomplex factor 2-like protein n=1 Tax=Hapsidospora chrysogenum (strain ATCC 11550 / CBS 779.69 / DSM 880 / IAM 14645 / JCM 23072 / IMI 49137) TaxID=857340 RepID=A0A086T1D9_HAPC1|nr:Respiratory supercomplex factor 2 -like protein [Hapsidospora chrysogenum ATCC 11550]